MNEAGKQNLYPYKKDEKTGYINSKGEIVIEAKYYSGNPFHCGVAYVQKENTGWSGMYINNRGETVYDLWSQASPGYVKWFNEGYCPVQLDKDTFGVINTEGQLIFEIKCAEIGECHDGCFWICFNYGGPYKYINIKKEYLFDGEEFDCASDFLNGSAIVGKDENFYLLNINGKKEPVKSKNQIRWIQDFENDYAEVSFEDRESALIDRKGNILESDKVPFFTPFMSENGIFSFTDNSGSPVSAEEVFKIYGIEDELMLINDLIEKGEWNDYYEYHEQDRYSRTYINSKGEVVFHWDD